MVDFLDVLGEALGTLDKMRLRKGAVLFRQGDVGQSMYVVLHGRLQALLKEETGEQISVGQIGPGEPVGEMQVLTGGRRTATVMALDDTELITLPAHQFEQLGVEDPALFAQLEHVILQRLRRNNLLLLLPELFGSLDEIELQTLEEQLEWCHLKRGERLIQQGDLGDAMYIVLSGRLHILVDDGQGEEKVVLEIGRGETVGEMALFNNTLRTASVDVVRDSTLVRLSQRAFTTTMAQFPKLHEYVTRAVMRRLERAARPTRPVPHVVNIAVVPLDSALQISRFTESLEQALRAFGSTLRVSRERLSQLADFRPQVEWFDNRLDRLGLSVWLEQLGQQYRFILFEAEPSPSSWTKRLIQQADRVLWLADATASPDLTALERACLDHTTSSQQMLLLLHPEQTRMPSETAAWLSPRQAKHHFHLRFDNTGDMARIARFLAGRSIGLVLGGGGARGFAHIGVIRAFREAGIPIDMVGGTSMGAVIAAHAAMELGHDEILVRNRQAFVEEKPFRRQGLPLFSFYKSRKLDEVTHQILYQESSIEDLWLPCFIVSCSLGTAELVVHERGKVWEAIRASTALPGIVTPVSDGQRLHVDGGLMNNLPVDLMQERCPGRIVAVEVSDLIDLDTQGLAPPSLLAYFKDRWLRLPSPTPFPSILEILMRSLLLGSRQRAKQARQLADLVLRPPVEQFRLLAFESIEEVAEAGYRYAKERLARWQIQDG